MDKEVCMIFRRGSKEPEGVYSRAYHNEYEFKSVEAARSSNVHDIYKDTSRYKINRYKVTYELIEEDAQ